MTLEPRTEQAEKKKNEAYAKVLNDDSSFEEKDTDYFSKYYNI